jgi:putative colanic acid biosysnthesis UDP-glucose lipid carrier transferase
MQNRFLYSVCFILAIIDLLFINGSYFIAYQVYSGPRLSGEILRHHLFNLNLIWLISSNYFQLYKKNNIQKIEQILRSTWKSLVVHVVIFTTSIVVLRDTNVSVKFILIFYCICFGTFLISRFLITVAETVLTRRYKIRKPVAVMGLNEMGLRLASFFEGNNKQYLFKGFLDPEHSYYVDKSGTLLPAVSEQIKNAAANNIQEVYVTLSTDRMGEVNHLLQEAEKQCVR